MKHPKSAVWSWIGFWCIGAVAVLFLALLFSRLGAPAPIAAPSLDSTSSILLIREPYSELDAEYSELELMNAPINTDPANETVEYRDMEHDFSLFLPYNPKWGVNRFQLEPFERTEDPLGKSVVAFGPLRIIPFEGCCWIGREFYLSAEPKRTVEQIKSSEFEKSKIEIVKIGSYQVAKLTYKCPDQEGIAGYPEDANCFFGLNTRYEIPLKETNILITGSTFAQNPDPAIEDMIKSIRELE